MTSLICSLFLAASVVTVDTGAAKCPTSPDLWGLFFEDIDLSLDGGVYAELVRNRSFEDFNGKSDELTLEYWDPVGRAECVLETKKNAHPHDRHCVAVSGVAGSGIANQGYFGMGVRAGLAYNLEIALKSSDCAELEVALEAYGKPTLATARVTGVTDDWQTFRATLVSNATDPQARLVIRMTTPGRMLVDHVSLFPSDAVAGLFRADLVAKLAALKPSFVRFPGGCWVEGETMKEAYRWKQTLGDKWNRRTQWNIWKYWSTNGVGFHEYLLLAEALQAKPLFCINVGMSHKETVPMEKMGEFVQDALDCLEYCNGDVTTEWGAKRAAAGHPEPFNLKYLEIGNENGGKAYEERYKLIADAVAAKYPDVTLVFNNWRETKAIKNGARADMRDDHFYTTPDRMMGDLTHEYDAPKGDFDIFVGEYAVIKNTTRYGSLRAAIGEAAFMCGLERNQDTVKLAAYAPLFANAQHTVWTPNLIYPTTDGCFVNPSWNVQRIFGAYRGDEVLNVKVETETFRTKTNEPWTKGTRENTIEKVQASAVRAKDGMVIVKLVNVTEEPQDVALNLRGAAKRLVFTGEGRDAHNTPYAPETLQERVDETCIENGLTLPPLSLTVLSFRPCPASEGVELYPLSQVRLSQTGVFAPAVKAGVAYVKTLEVDRLLAPFRREAGLPEKAKSYGNWESTGLDGHTLGHYLSALSNLIAAGADADGELKRRLDYLVAELAACQEANGDGRLDGIPKGAELWMALRQGDVGKVWKRWVPWYNVHKTFAGLRDAYEVAGNVQAKEVLVRLADWAIDVTANLDARGMQKMLDCEYGGMNETFADVYAITRAPKYLETARRWEHQSVFDPLYRHEDRLSGLHANTQIPKFTGLARTAQLSDDAARWDAADFAWRTIVTRRSVAFGGNSVGEHFHALESFEKLMSDREGPETCNTYNMLRLTERLFEHEPKAEYAAYYERALYNHILSSVNPAHPGFVYFTPTRPGHYRVYSTTTNCFWCCSGTGMENTGKYGRFIYAHRGDDTIYVNLFIDSELKGVLRQTTDFPESGATTLTFLKPFAGTVYVREGERYAKHVGTWKSGDTIRAARPMDWHVEMLPDGSAWGAIMRGPIVMGRDCGAARLDGLYADDSRMGHVAHGPFADPREVEIRLADGPLDTTGLKPFYTLHDCRYQIYWEFTTPEKLAAER